jgi:hypothetical protein
MISKRKAISFLSLLLVPAAIIACGTLPIRKVSKEGSLRKIQAGPEAGYTIKQELTSVTEVVWKLDEKEEVSLERSRKTGLKVVAFYEVVERKGDRVNVQVTLEKVEVLKDGRFIKAPFMQFGPPNTLLFSVDFGDETVDFSLLERAYDDWVKSLQETAIWDVMGSSFDVTSYVAQLENLLSSPITEFAGRTMRLGAEDVEERTFYLPFLGPTISVEPVLVEQKRGMRGVMDLAGREIAMIEGEQFSDKLSVGTEILAGRMELFGRTAPEYYESRGELAGKFRARVDTNSGWTVETTRKFRSVTIVNFENGMLREDISGKKSVYEL